MIKQTIRLGGLVWALSILTVGPAMTGSSRLDVGHKAVNGKAIQPFSATWTQKQMMNGEWMDLGTITETVSATKLNGKTVMKREQMSSIPPIEGKKMETLVFNAETLAPISMKVESSGKFPPPATKTSSIEFKGQNVTGEITSFAGETRDINQKHETPMFEAAMLGLVLAALPLEDGYVAELPVNFVMQGSAWMVRATVTGNKAYASGDKKAEYWKVRTDWRDLSTEDGYPDDDSGGTYYVTSNPPDGFPYVARYVNPQVDIDLKVD